uniref:Uncharacterized protein n=1 Tax=Chromera velia CCMP2878 TaxID=1169474 RepID=A0A0G4FWK7_9ALVE|eukprot:Cvel_19141.t1-p1 / transcript=Cvel_19141.t1 / gene=Cvel_19141 / organism=Chromera_velia_CCMP2878 / gene_product=hypothetical protein / transcript_product=hypothetical protein / location=Cvel_scaffold1628:17762-28645(-) / protein_length=976 / sequence_SO=supercontig / SO=protein_coding / is_pseudo=false
MSERTTATQGRFLTGEDESRHPSQGVGGGGGSVEAAVPVLSSLFCHAVNPQLVSLLASNQLGYGLAWLILFFIKTRRLRESLTTLDLSEFSLGSRKLSLLLRFLPPDPSPSPLTTLTCGSRTCRGAPLSVVSAFLQRLRQGDGGGCAVHLETLNLAKCELRDVAGGIILSSLPSTLRCLDLSGNKLHRDCMGTLSAVLSSGWLSSLLTLDVSDNPLGPSGVSALSRALSASSASASPACPGDPLPLETLKLKRTFARAEGVRALSNALKAKRLTGLQSVDLGCNDLRSEGLKSLASAADAGGLPRMKSLFLNENFIAYDYMLTVDTGGLLQLFSSFHLTELEELDISDNSLRGDMGRFCSEAIAAGRLPKLKSLRHSGSSWFNVPGITALAQGMRGGQTAPLEVLDIVYSIVGGGGLGVLAEGVRESKFACLEELKVESLIGTSPSSFSAMGELGKALGSGCVSGLKGLSLTWFEQGDKGVSGIAEGLGAGGLPVLERLTLRSSNEAGEGCRTLGRVLSGEGRRRLPSLRQLILDWDGDESLGSVCEGLSSGSLPSSVAVVLIISSRKPEIAERGDRAVMALAAAIRSGKILGLQKVFFKSRLDLSRQTGRVFGEALTHADVTLASLEELSFRAAIFSGQKQQQREGMGELLAGIVEGRHSLPSLQTLRTIWSHFSPFHICVDEVGARAVASGIREAKFPSLKCFHLDCRDVLLEGLQPLALALASPHVSALRSLSIELGTPQEEASPAGVGLFSVALASGYLRALEELFIEENYGIDAARALFAGLGSGKLSCLRRLDLRHFFLDAQRVRELAQVLDARRLPSLQNLELARLNYTYGSFDAQPGIGDEGLRALVETWMERPPPPLEFLGLRANAFTDQAAQSLMLLLGSGRLRFLLLVDLGANAFSDQMRRQLRTAFPCVNAAADPGSRLFFLPEFLSEADSRCNTTPSHPPLSSGSLASADTPLGGGFGSSLPI